MAQTNKQKDLLGRLGDAGEEAISRVAGSQTANRLIDSVGGLKERLDDMQKKVRGIDELEQRVAKLEKQVADLKPKRSSSRSRASSTTRRSTPRKKPPSSQA